MQFIPILKPDYTSLLQFSIMLVLLFVWLIVPHDVVNAGYFSCSFRNCLAVILFIYFNQEGFIYSNNLYLFCTFFFHFEQICTV